MGDRCLQAVLVLGLNGVRLLNKEQVVHHDDKGDDIDGAAAEREMCIRDSLPCEPVHAREGAGAARLPP